KKYAHISPGLERHHGSSSLDRCTRQNTEGLAPRAPTVEMAGLGTEGDRIHPPRSQACHGVRSCSLRPMRYATTSRCSRWEPRVLELRCVVKNLPHMPCATVDTHSEKCCVNMLFNEDDAEQLFACQRKSRQRDP